MSDPIPSPSSIAVLCGGVGAARLLSGIMQVTDPATVTAIVNVGDDMNLHGLHISPDIDTILYTLSGAVSTERGWGLEGETWQAMAMLTRYGGEDWFNLGDKDLGTHLYRTQLLTQGDTLATVTASLAAAWGLELQLLPVTNDRLRTMVTTADHGEITFQEYFVGHQHSVPVSAVRFDGAAAAKPAPGVIEALEAAERIVIAPSNPVVSIDPVLAVPGVAETLQRNRDKVIAVSPIIGGKALKGPADRLMNELGREASAHAVAAWYADVCGHLVIDNADANATPTIEASGVTATVTDTIMATPERSAALAKVILTA